MANQPLTISRYPLQREVTVLPVITNRAGSRTENLFEPVPTARLGASTGLTKTGQEPGSSDELCPRRPTSKGLFLLRSHLLFHHQDIPPLLALIDHFIHEIADQMNP
jgi:hypothetical protein